MKAILIIKAPRGTRPDELQNIGEALKLFPKIHEDYHVMVFGSGAADDYVIEGLYPQDFDEKSFEELKKELKGALIVVTE